MSIKSYYLTNLTQSKMRKNILHGSTPSSFSTKLAMNYQNSEQINKYPK